MIKLFHHVMKLAILAAVVLVISQTRIKKTRICDYVYHIVEMPQIQKPIHWIAVRFDQSAGDVKMRVADHTLKDKGMTGPEYSKSDRARLSGILKHARFKH